ncbi:MAG: epoxyqueuosine reductase [Syntrophales bacterium]|nr:epoxyqueuosine reductase [Syntrophales bacterium]
MERVRLMERKMKQEFSHRLIRLIVQIIRDFVAQSPLNRLEHFSGDPIFDEPLVGFVGSADPIFHQFRNVVHPDHLLPEEVLARVFGQAFPISTVVSFVLPIAEKTKKANAAEKKGPALRWNHTRWHGQFFIEALSRHIVSSLERMGLLAVAPELTDIFSIVSGPNGIASLWSQRHIAYAAGLGTFGLSDALITEKGAAMRCGSVIVVGEMEVSPRPYSDHHAYCLYYRTGTCQMCLKRCPRGAITPAGHNKTLCLEILTVDQKPWLDGIYGPGYIGKYAGCGLCMTGVPCESRIPKADDVTS